MALSCGLVHYDPATGKYTWAAVAMMRVTGILTVVILGTVIGTMIYRESQKKAHQPRPQRMEAGTGPGKPNC